ncbi:lytic transglycosylase domain-containing protein [Haloechinothrix alba]|uniref:lytic transglycosylase domain-containing protein n=1 Tax=Haloechinothrix alba TaxID=664784 RepID=UPI001C3E05D5|nr:lytic transglycosylase domain-containing protein [Haloechinothrix alba]
MARRTINPILPLALAAVLSGCDPTPGSDPTPSPTAPQQQTATSPTESDPSPEPPRRIAPFESPGDLADVLADAEQALADPGTAEAERTRWAHAHQQAYRDLAANPQWREPVRNALPEAFRETFDATFRAVRQLRQLHTPESDVPSGWEIHPPPPLDELRGYYEEAEQAYGVPWSVLAAIHLVETRFGRIHGDSNAGAQGPMQFLPETWQAYGDGDVHDPRDAIMGAGRYLAASGAPDNLRQALFAYNRSEHYVAAILAHAEAMRLADHYADAYHRWRVYFRTDEGDVVLEEGYGT